MTLKTPEQYKESLRDGRVIYWNGERIDDVTRHPGFKVPLELVMRDFNYEDPKLGPILSYATEDGSKANRIYQIPRNEGDLDARMKLMHEISVVTGVSGVFMALMSAKDAIGKEHPQYAANIERMYKYARDNDLRGAEVITDAKGDRKRRANEQDDPDLYLRIVKRTDAGIVVRGAKLHITGASLVHELVVMPTKGMRADETDYAVSFSIPVNAPGVTIINRSFARTDLNEFDFPASSRHSMPEGFVVFDDVFVPWDRVFLAGEAAFASTLAQSLGLWERTAGLVEAIKISQLLIGLGQLVSEMQGKEKDPTVQSVMADLICFSEMVRMSLDYACQRYARTDGGMVYPNTLAINSGKYYFAVNYHEMVRNLQDISGGLVATLPVEADLRNDVAGAYLRKYLHTRPDVDIEARMRVFNLIRDVTAEAYGGWLMITALQGGGGLNAQRIMMNRAYDLATAKKRALAAAGVK